MEVSDAVEQLASVKRFPGITGLSSSTMSRGEKCLMADGGADCGGGA